MIDLDNEERARCLRETVALYVDLTPEQRETWIEKLRRDCALSEHGPVDEVVSSAFCDCDVGDPRFDRGVDVALAGYYGDDPADALVEMGEA